MVCVYVWNTGSQQPKSWFWLNLSPLANDCNNPIYQLHERERPYSFLLGVITYMDWEIVTHATPFSTHTQTHTRNHTRVHNLFATNYMSWGGKLHMTVPLLAIQTTHERHTIICCCINRCLDAAASGRQWKTTSFPSIRDGIVLIRGNDWALKQKITNI